MYRVTTSPSPDDLTEDVDLTDPSGWREPPYSGGASSFGAALFGDEKAGPFTAFYSNPPRDERTPCTPGHGHGSDSWRIALRGQMRVGSQTYRAGAFRFQQGGAIYGADDSPWGPEGGCSVVMMGDRRGASAIPAHDRDRERFLGSGDTFNRWLGMPPREPFHAEQCLATTFGMPRNGRVNGSFADTWPEIAPGVQFAAGILGDLVAGPIVILTKAEAGRTALPALTLTSDIMHIVAAGSTLGARPLRSCQVRLVAEGAPGEAMVAGDEGLCLATIIGDRRAWNGLRTHAGEWLGPVGRQIGALLSVARQTPAAGQAHPPGAAAGNVGAAISPPS